MITGSYNIFQIVLERYIFSDSNEMSSNVLTSDVLVLGAGMGGVSAAKTLSDLGIKNMIVLEGSDRFLHIF